MTLRCSRQSRALRIIRKKGASPEHIIKIVRFSISGFGHHLENRSILASSSRHRTNARSLAAPSAMIRLLREGPTVRPHIADSGKRERPVGTPKPLNLFEGGHFGRPKSLRRLIHRYKFAEHVEGKPQRALNVDLLKLLPEHHLCVQKRATWSARNRRRDRIAFAGSYSANRGSVRPGSIWSAICIA